VRRVFADTLYWIALMNPRDQWRDRALAASQSLRDACLVTTEEVLTEVLNGLSAAGPHMRADASVEIVPQDHQTFEFGLALYRQRADKTYSLTDCISMQTMRRLGIQEALTHDHHFTQEGFVILL
jgi:predicted nucleic acid-binding protein